MRTGRTLRASRAGLAVAAALVLSAGTIQAEFSTERPSSILIFPKVINAAERDTVIQITNTSNLVRQARCFYVNGAPVNPNFPPGPTNPPQWSVTDFAITLTAQQPTHWLVSEGRAVNPVDEQAGIDPGAVPPVPPGFTGELVCVEVDGAMAPLPANSLKGEATIGDVAGTDVAKYNAVGVEADPDGDSLGAFDDLDLVLDNDEFSACPGGLLWNVGAEDSSDDIIDELGGGASLVQSTVTLTPCSRDFANVIPSRITVNFVITNEFEESFGTTTTVDCWAAISLADVGLPTDIGSSFGTVRITRVDDPDAGDAGVIGVGSTRRTDLGTGASGTAAVNLHFLDNDPDIVVTDPAVIRIVNF